MITFHITRLIQPTHKAVRLISIVSVSRVIGTVLRRSRNPAYRWKFLKISNRRDIFKSQ